MLVYLRVIRGLIFQWQDLHDLRRFVHLLQRLDGLVLAKAAASRGPNLPVNGTDNVINSGRVILEQRRVEKLAQGRPESGEPLGADGSVEIQTGRVVRQLVVVLAAVVLRREL